MGGCKKSNMALRKFKGMNQHSYVHMVDLWLTHRQLGIFKLLAAGYNTKEIAGLQECSQRVIYNCMKRAVDRNDWKNTWQAIYFITQKKLI